MLTIGDSKTSRNEWQPGLVAELNTRAPECFWYYDNKGIASTTVASWAGIIDATMATVIIEPEVVLLNIGVNNWTPVMPNEATWKANYQTIIDAIHTKYANSRIYIAKVWTSSNDVNAATMAGWIDDLITANGGVVIEGHNEPVWLDGGDEGATMTLDGTHYNVAGYTECMNQWLTILGY